MLTREQSGKKSHFHATFRSDYEIWSCAKVAVITAISSRTRKGDVENKYIKLPRARKKWRPVANARREVQIEWLAKLIARMESSLDIVVHQHTQTYSGMVVGITLSSGCESASKILQGEETENNSTTMAIAFSGRHYEFRFQARP